MFFTPWRAKNWSRLSEVGPLWQPTFMRTGLRFREGWAEVNGEEPAPAAAPAAVTMKCLRFINGIQANRERTPIGSFDSSKTFRFVCFACFVGEMLFPGPSNVSRHEYMVPAIRIAADGIVNDMRSQARLRCHENAAVREANVPDIPVQQRCPSNISGPPGIQRHRAT